MKKESYERRSPRSHVAIIDRELANWEACYREGTAKKYRKVVGKK